MKIGDLLCDRLANVFGGLDNDVAPSTADTIFCRVSP